MKILFLTHYYPPEVNAPATRTFDHCKRWGQSGHDVTVITCVPRFVCSYVGTIGMAHGLEVIPAAARILKSKGRHDIGFLLVGDGAARKRLEKQVRDAGLGESVVFAGRQPREEIPALLASSNACLIHLKSCELFGTVIPSKIFETMAMGRPTVMGVRGEARDIVLQAGAGVPMEPDSAESLAGAVEQLADSPRRTSLLGRWARKTVVQCYNRDVLAVRFLELLEEVTGVRRPISYESTTAGRDP